MLQGIALLPALKPYNFVTNIMAVSLIKTLNLIICRLCHEILAGRGEMSDHRRNTCILNVFLILYSLIFQANYVIHNAHLLLFV
jgi:hypothetical protein